MAATELPIAQATSSGRGSLPAVNDKDVMYHHTTSTTSRACSTQHPKHNAKRSVCVWTPKGRKWWGQSPLPHHLQVYTLHGCDEKVYYNDLLKRRSVLREVLSLSAFPMFNKKASQPSSLKTSKFLLLARLLSTSSQPLSSCGKGTGISKTSALQRVGGEVRINMWVYVCVCCVWAHVYAYTCMCVTSELLRNWKFTLKVRHRDAQ